MDMGPFCTITRTLHWTLCHVFHGISSLVNLYMHTFWLVCIILRVTSTTAAAHRYKYHFYIVKSQISFFLVVQGFLNFRNLRVHFCMAFLGNCRRNYTVPWRFEGATPLNIKSPKCPSLKCLF